jgi:transposase
LTRAQAARLDVVRRARALLAVAQGHSFAAAAAFAGYQSRATLSALIRRFNAQGSAVLLLARGRGPHPRYPSTVRTLILSTLQHPPDRAQDGTATWSLATLQHHLRQADPALRTLGRTTIWRVLHAAGYSYQRSRTWCTTGQVQRRGPDGPRLVVDPRWAEKQAVIEYVYQAGERLGVPVWCEDEAGPYQAIPQPGRQWALQGHPTRQPHEYVRGGTAKLLTLFRPATGEVRAKAVEHTTNAELHPWLQQQMRAILATQTTPLPAGQGELGRLWEDWWGPHLPGRVPALRCILVWDNLAGHRSFDLRQWLRREGVMVVTTPVGGSWLNMAESVQRILGQRALTGQQPTSAEQIMTWLEDTVAGWNTHPTPFVWGGKRRERRQRARLRRLAGSGAALLAVN